MRVLCVGVCVRSVMVTIINIYNDPISTPGVGSLHFT